MAWTTPDSTPTGTFTASRWDTYIRDNLVYLHDFFALLAQNQSGMAVTLGQIVILDPTQDGVFLTTTTPGDSTLVGVAQSNIADTQSGYIAILGRVNALTVTGVVGRQVELQTSATARVAQAGAGNSFARSLSAVAGPGLGSVSAFIHNRGAVAAHVIQDLLGDFAQRTNLQFATDLRVSDDVGNDASVVSLAPTVTPTILTTAGPATLTAAQLKGHLILRDPNGASRSDTLPTAALLVAALTAPRVQDSVVFTIRNTGGAGENLTLLAGAGVTLSGTMTINEGETRQFVAVLTNVGSGTEAYTVYALTSDAASGSGSGTTPWSSILAFG